MSQTNLSWDQLTTDTATKILYFFGNKFENLYPRMSRDDFVQETLLRLMSGTRRFDPEHESGLTFYKWLATIVRFTMMDIYREKRKARIRSEDAKKISNPTHNDSAMLRTPSSTQNPLDRLIEEENLKTVLEDIAESPEGVQTFFHLRKQGIQTKKIREATRPIDYYRFLDLRDKVCD